MNNDKQTQFKLEQIENKNDISAVSEMAREIWFEYYVPIIGEEQVKYMTENFQSADAIQKQIEEENFRYYFMNTGDERIGYIAVLFEKGKCFLSKFYMYKKARGGGYGRKTIKAAEELCRSENASHIWLTVNRDNPTLNIYSRLGFLNMGVQQKDIGDGFIMDDFIMEKKVEKV